jgi:hypothetical protein
LSAPALHDEPNGRPGDRLPVPLETRPPADSVAAWRWTALRLSALLVATEARTAAGEAEVERLRRRVQELESWLQQSARYDEVEHVQLGRLLALDSAEREERRLPLLASTRAVMLFVYAAAALALAILMLAPQLWP